MSAEISKEAYDDLVAELESARAWVIHWTEDVRCHLKPTEASLAKALAEIDAALQRARKQTP